MPRNLPCVPLAVLHASILSLVISSSTAIVPLLRQISVKRQHPWQQATSSLLLCSAVSCRMLAKVLLVLAQFVIVGSGRCPCGPARPSGEGHLRQHHDGGGDGGKSGTSVGVNEVRAHSCLNPHSLHVAVGLYPCDS